jgi:hypothetical protein
MAGVELPDELPERWIERAEREFGGRVPSAFSD